MTTINIDLERNQITELREMLLGGLEALGQIERTQDSIKLFELTGGTLPDDIKPLHPFGHVGWLAEYSGALRTVELIDSLCAKAEAGDAQP